MKTMKNRSPFGIAAACLLSVVSLHAVQITINEDSATRFDYHAFWGDGPGIAIAQDTSVAMIGMTGRPYGAEARIEATPVSLGLGAVVTDIPVDFSFEVLPVIDLEAPHEVFAYASPKVVPAGHYFIDDDLRGARFVFGRAIECPGGRIPSRSVWSAPRGKPLDEESLASCNALAERPISRAARSGKPKRQKGGYVLHF